MASPTSAVFRLLPVHLLSTAGALVPTKAPAISLMAPEFLKLLAPTNHDAYRRNLGSSEVKIGSFVGLSVRPDLFGEGLRWPGGAVEDARLIEFFTAARALGRRLRMTAPETAHPLVTFILTRHDRGSDISWWLKNNPTLMDRLVATWQVLEVKRPIGTGVTEESSSR